MLLITVKTEIGSGDDAIETYDLRDISIEKDLNNLVQTCSFKLPDISDYRNFKKYDALRIYISNSDANPAYTNKRIFTGYIQSINPIKEKSNKEISFKAFDLLGLTNDRTLFYPVIENKLSDMATTILSATNLLDTGDGSLIIYDSSVDYQMNELMVNIEGGHNLKEIFDNIKEKHAVYIFLTGEGRLRITSPFFLHQLRKTTSENSSQSIDAWEFEIGENIFMIDYGDVTTDLNTIIVEGIGTGNDSVPKYSMGVAIDAIGVQLSGGNYVYEVIKRYDVAGQEQADEIARNILLDRQRNHQIELKVPFSPYYELGDPFTIQNDDRFTGNEVFIMKTISHTINKDDISTRITGYKHSLTDLPSEIVLDATGIADVDSLVSIEKGEQTNYWSD